MTVPPNGGTRLGCVREKESLPHLSDSFARMRLRTKRNCAICVLRWRWSGERARARTLWESMRPSYLKQRSGVLPVCRVYVRLRSTVSAYSKT